MDHNEHIISSPKKLFSKKTREKAEKIKKFLLNKYVLSIIAMVCYCVTMIISCVDYHNNLN